MSKMIQLRDVPDSLHRRLKARAALAGLSLSDFLVREARKVAERPTVDEMRARLRARTPWRGAATPAELVRQERDER